MIELFYLSVSFEKPPKKLRFLRDFLLLLFAIAANIRPELFEHHGQCGLSIAAPSSPHGSAISRDTMRGIGSAAALDITLFDMPTVLHFYKLSIAICKTKSVASIPDAFIRCCKYWKITLVSSVWPIELIGFAGSSYI